MKYQEWQKKTSRFAAMTGYTVEKFNGRCLTSGKHMMNIYLNTI
jgi:hypothetical protein